MTQPNPNPFPKRDPLRAGIRAGKWVLGAMALGIILFFALSNRRCYELQHGITHKECHPSNVGAGTVEAVVEQTLQSVFAMSCERPFGGCGLFVDATVTRSGEKCVLETSPKVAAEWFNIQETVYCQEKPMQ